LVGLSHLHDKGIIHRDLKPANVCVNSKGSAKLTDFGISREVQNSLHKCRTECGTFTYMSPERIQGFEYSYPSDVWSLGLLLVESATGRYPYREKESGMQMELLAAILDRPPPTLPDEMSTEFHDFIQRCLRKNPHERANVQLLLEHPWLADAQTENLVSFVFQNDLTFQED